MDLSDSFLNNLASIAFTIVKNASIVAKEVQVVQWINM